MDDERITVLPVAAPASASAAEWHVIHDGKELGPLTLAELVERAAAGKIEADDLVKQTGGLWNKARELTFLRDARAERRRPQQLHPKDCREDISQSTPAKTSREQRTVSPAAWVMFTIGAVFFLSGALRHNLSAYFIWGLIFAGCAWSCYWGKRRNGMTIVATMFFLVGGLPVASAVYSHYAFPPAPRQGAIAPPNGILPGVDHGGPALPGLEPEAQSPPQPASEAQSSPPPESPPQAESPSPSPSSLGQDAVARSLAALGAGRQPSAEERGQAVIDEFRGHPNSNAGYNALVNSYRAIGVDLDKERREQRTNRELNDWHARVANSEENWNSWLARHVNTFLPIKNDAAYARAMDRARQGNLEPGDAELIATQERLGQLDAGK